MTQTKVTDYELLDHGVNGSQYFQGCGIAFTPYNNVTTGCGEDFGEALEDALEQVAQQGFDAKSLKRQIRTDEGYIRKPWPTKPSATSVFEKYNPDAKDEDGEWDYDGCDLYYYVSIRWS